MEHDLLAMVESINASAEFNRWCGFEVTACELGAVALSMRWRREAGQYSGFLHAGVTAALIDTACGFAAATVAGPHLLAAHVSINCLRPAVGQRFIARARVVKPGRQQVFTACELYGIEDGVEKLVATGETLLSVLPGAVQGTVLPTKRAPASSSACTAGAVCVLMPDIASTKVARRRSGSPRRRTGP